MNSNCAKESGYVQIIEIFQPIFYCWLFGLHSELHKILWLSMHDFTVSFEQNNPQTFVNN